MAIRKISIMKYEQGVLIEEKEPYTVNGRTRYDSAKVYITIDELKKAIKIAEKHEEVE